ncbi:MAG: FtsX-like permease family protein [Candidatus Sulfotelmatobacter sp.]
MTNAVVLLLVIACLNVANLLLVRCDQRRRELAVRSALGSGRSRLIRYLLTETLSISFAGATLGIFVAVMAVRYFNSTSPIELPPGNQVGVNLDVLGFSVSSRCSLVSSAGVYPSGACCALTSTKY